MRRYEKGTQTVMKSFLRPQGLKGWRPVPSKPARRRVILGLLVVPVMIVSCGTAPQIQADSTRSHEATHVEQQPEAYFHFLRGYLAELANDQPRALEEYRQGLSYDPDSIYLRIRMAKLYLARGELGSAAAVADQIPLERLSNTADLLQVAKVYAGADRSDRALALYDRAIAIDPDQTDPYLLKGVLLLTEKRNEEARQVFEAALRKAPASPEAHYYLGLIENNADRLMEAETHFRQAIEASPTFRRAYQALATVYEKRGEEARAIEVYEGYLKSVNPHYKEFRTQLVRLYVHAKSYEQALRHLDRILDASPNDLSALVRKASIYGQMGNYQKAVDDLRAILRKRPNELRIRDYLGLVYEEMQDFEQAVQAYKTNLEIDPTFFESLLHLGFLSYRLKRYEEAIPYLTQASKINPKRSESYLLLGLTYLQMEQYQLAMARLQEGIEMDPTNADLHFNLGTAYDKLDRFDDVVREMEKTLALNPKHADALNYLGYSYADRGIHVEEALKLTKRAVELRPDNGYYVDSLGWALFKLGRWDEALQTIQRALSLVSDDPVIFEHLGEIYLRLEEREKAKEAWSRSIRLDSTNQKLIQRYREQGFGEPIRHDVDDATLPKVSHSPATSELVP